jgi:erythritol kinase (D-erythritol 1-phosphate-forming)
MTRDLLIGVDAGTSVLKAVAFTLSGEQLAVAARPNAYDNLGGGRIEQDMARTWRDCAETLAELGKRVPDLALRAAALSITAQGDGCWLVDAAGEPIGGGLLWLDSRAAGIVEDYLRSDAYPRHYALTGSGVNACMASAQMAWMKRYQPERLDRAATCFHCKDWLYFRLTGERVTDPSESMFTFGDFRTRTYRPEILEGMGIADCLTLLPPVIEGSRQSHPLSTTAAGATGLPQGLPVTLGYVDVICSSLGGGLYDRSGRVGFSIFGSTGMHMRYVPNVADVKLNEACSGYTMCFPIEGSCASMQSNMAATLNIDWILDIVCEAAELAGARTSRKMLLKDLDAKILATPPGQAIFHPYILEAGERGPFLNPNARAQFIGLSSRAGLLGLIRSVYEGLAFAARDCYAAAGAPPEEVRMGGGAARSEALRSIVAAALGSQVRVLSREELGSAGAAMMAAACIGAYPDVAACAEHWVTPSLGATTAPDPDLASRYAEIFPVYRMVRDAMIPIWTKLSELRREGLS